MKNYYRNKRRKVGLSQSDMAKELGIPCVKYEQIERGEIKMPKRLMDKFNEIINRGNNIHSLEKLEHEREVNEYYDWLVAGNLKSEMERFNISTKEKLGKMLGYGGGSMVCKGMKHPDLVSYDFKNKIYLFFHDELNMQPKSDGKRDLSKREKKQDVLIKRVKKYCKENKMSQRALANEIDMSESTFCRFIAKKQIMTDKNLNKIIKFLNTHGDITYDQSEELLQKHLFETPKSNEEFNLTFPNIPTDISEVDEPTVSLDPTCFPDGIIEINGIRRVENTTPNVTADETDSKEVYGIKKIYHENHEKIQKLTEEINKLVQREDVLLDILKEIERL